MTDSHAKNTIMPQVNSLHTFCLLSERTSCFNATTTLRTCVTPTVTKPQWNLVAGWSRTEDVVRYSVMTQLTIEGHATKLVHVSLVSWSSFLLTNHFLVSRQSHLTHYNSIS